MQLGDEVLGAQRRALARGDLRAHVRRRPSRRAAALQRRLGMLALAVNRGSAAELLRADRHDELPVAPGEHAPSAAAHARAPARPPPAPALTDSTNERARALAAAGAPHGTLVTAAEQTRGPRAAGPALDGAGGSSLLASLVLRPPPRLLPLPQPSRSRRRGRSPGRDGRAAPIKWPNDVLLETATGSQARRHPRRGPAAGGLGRAGDRHQRRRRLGRAARGAAEQAATLGARRAGRLEPRSRAAGRLGARLAEPPAETLAALGARATRSRAAIAWGPRGRAAPSAGSRHRARDRRRRPAARRADGGGRTALDAGEVHLRAAAERPGRRSPRGPLAGCDG